MSLTSPLALVPASVSRRGVLSLLAGAALWFGGARPAVAQGTGPSLVILVRHAEKADASADPNLSAAGTERAKALAEALAGTTPSTIIVSPTKRTHETAAPLATKHGITPQAVSLAGGGAAHVAAVAEAVKKSRGVVVVVGHSNTIPAIVKALGGPAYPEICEAHFANLFVVHPIAGGGAPSVVRASYGSPDPVGAPGCAPMTPSR